VRSSAPACPRCRPHLPLPAVPPLLQDPWCRVLPAAPPAPLQPCASSQPQGSRAGAAPGARTGAQSSAGGQRSRRTAPVPPLKPSSRGTAACPAAPRSRGPRTAPAAAPPPRCLFSPALITLSEQGFFPVPTRHPPYLWELTIPRHVSITTSSQVGPGAPMRFVLHGDMCGHACQGAWAARACGGVGGGACVRGHLMAPTGSGSEGPPPSRCGLRHVPAQGPSARAQRGAKATNKPGARWLFAAASHLAPHK